MNIDVHILLSFVSMLFSIHMLGMQIKEKNPVYNAVCMHNPAELASLFLSSPCMGLKYINIPDSNGQTALHRAVITGQGVIVKILLSNGADCNKKDTLKRTPLHHAVISRNIEIVELLLLRGASIHHRDHATRTPLYYAETFNCPEIVSMLLSYR
ncbi:MAG TPA: ankyrin repeat domain-containing protein [Candidatus Dependentiae bacterium]|nr:ankyrin repeat domain-containing protein [Candidatus Dependentiae bacterium]